MKPCRVCGCTLTTENRAKVRGYVCKPCENRRHRESRASDVVGTLLEKARERARRKNIAFKLKRDDIKIPDVCPVLGIQLRKAVGMVDDNSPTLDRVIPSLGYVPDNIIVVSWRANRLKSDASIDELARIYSFYKDYEGSA